MSNIMMKLLDTPAGELFDRQVASYDRQMSGDVARFPDLIKQIESLGEETEYFERYAIYMKWAIRKLEYDFVLDNVQLDLGIKVLDVGSGVTILPHVLSKLGYEVSALDPTPDWKLPNTRIGALYNSFYCTNVRYINDYVHGIQGDELYDNVISVSVLEHLPKTELKNTLTKILKLLKPGGRLILTIDYSPRVRDSRFDLLTGMLFRLSGWFGLQIEPSYSGFSYSQFKNLIFGYLPGRGDLAGLKRQDEMATSYHDFWAPHAFEGCLYQGYRPYLSLGIICTKPEASS